jgi:hypothetical protein
MTSSTPNTPRRKRRWLVRGLFILLIVGAVAYLFREELQDEWQLRQFRQAAARNDPNLPQYQERLLKRLLVDEEKLDLAVRLANDSDPNVRAASVAVLLANQPRAKKQDAPQGLVAVGKFGSWRLRVEEAINRLLEDQDANVRKRALQVVSELEWASVFQSLLENALKNGSEEERVLVAERLAHWNQSLIWQTIGDGNQPDPVRLAAMQSMDHYGDHEIAIARDKLETSLKTALQSENKDLRRGALVALRYAERPASVWLDILCDDRYKEDYSLILRTWIDALGNETVRGRYWWATHDAWYRTGQTPHRCAVANYVMCESAKIQMQHLDKTLPIAEHVALQDRQGPTGRAFDAQLLHLENILSVVSAVRWYCENIDKDAELTVWLPHENPQGNPPVRKLKAYLFQQVEPIWEWCSHKQAAYSTRFLSANNVQNYAHRQVPQPIPVRPLGAVMDELLIGQTEYEKLRDRYRKN